MTPFPLPLIGVCAYSGTGKTTLLTRLIPVLIARGLRIGVVKHAHHKFEIDHPGKDSHAFRKAGAEQVAVASNRRIAWIREYRGRNDEPRLADALAALDTSGLDLVIVEGFKHEHFPKIELHRPDLGRPLLCTDDEHIIALATDAPVHTPAGLPVLDLNNVDEIAEFVLAFARGKSEAAPSDPPGGQVTGTC